MEIDMRQILDDDHRAIPMYIRVLCNGRPVSTAIMASEEKGVVVRYVTGTLAGEIERVFGQVVIELVEEAPKSVKLAYQRIRDKEKNPVKVMHAEHERLIKAAKALELAKREFRSFVVAEDNYEKSDQLAMNVGIKQQELRKATEELIELEGV